MTAPTDVTAVLNGLTMGTGTKYVFDAGGIDGLGVPETKTADAVYDGRDGAFAAPDYLGVRIVTLPLVLLGDDVAEAFNLLAALNAAWAPIYNGVDVILELTLPGWGAVELIGRPRGVVANTANMKNATMAALCRFDGLNPNFIAPGS